MKHIGRGWIALFAVILVGVIAVSGFSQTSPAQYLTPEIIENWIANQDAISEELENLEANPDAAVQEQMLKYWEKVQVFSYHLETLLVLRYSDENRTFQGDPVQAYRKVLRIHVPAAIKTVYAEKGLGDQGHQVFMCLVLGLILAEQNQEPKGADIPLPHKAQKTLNNLKSLIHPQDLALIQEYAEDLLY